MGWIYLDSSITVESDPVFAASAAAGISAGNISNWNTAYGWGDHAGLYDATGTASGLVGTHESTYNHTNYNTAYGWGDHTGLYDLVGAASTAVGTHESTYNHANYNTAYGWGDHAGLYEPINANIQAHISDVTTNPHGVTAALAGAEPANANIQSHISSTSNPHSVVYSDVMPIGLAGDDGEYLRYNWNGGSPTVTWEAAGGGGTDLSGLGLDLRLPRWNGTDTLDYSTLSVADTSGNISNTYTAGAWSIKQDNLSSGSGNDTTLEAQGTTDATNTAGGDLNLKSGITTYASAREGSSVNIHGSYPGGTHKLVAEFHGYGKAGTNAPTVFFHSATANNGLKFYNGALLSYNVGSTSYDKFEFFAGAGVNIKTDLYSSGNRNIGAASAAAFSNIYSEATIYAGATTCPAGDRLELSNQSVKQDDTVLNAAGKSLTIEAGDAEGTDTNDYDGGDLNLTPGAAANDGSDGNVNITRGDLEMAGTPVLTSQQAAIADVATTTTVGANTGTSGAGLSLIGDTSSADQSAALMNDLVALQEDILDLKTQLNDALAKLRTHGLIAT